MTKQFEAAIKAIAAISEQGVVADAEAPAHLEQINALAAAVQALKAPYKKIMDREASRKSRARKADEVAAMKVRIAELEASAKA